MTVRKLTQQEKVRREKLQFLIDSGVKPFGGRFDRTTNSQEIASSYDKEEFSQSYFEENIIRVKIAGRILQKRRMGKIGFMHIQDKFGKTQIYVAKNEIGEASYEIFKKADLGDIIGIDGHLFKSDTGELTVRTDVYTHLTKALKPLPEKFHGLQDVEEARRHRYIDLIMNKETRARSFARPRIIRAIQNYFDSRGFVEVETPVLHAVLGGASARPFTTHHNTLDMDFYLRIATELALKKLIVGDMEAVYEIGRLFRNEGMDATHNPEFTTVEAYLAYSDLDGMMDLVEELFKFVSIEVLATSKVTWRGKEIDLGKPFIKLHMVDAIKNVCGVDFWKEMSLEEATAIAETHKIDVPAHYTGVGHIINAFFEKYVEDTLIQPTLLYGHPLEISPLAKKSEADPRFTDRFELFIDTKEFANAFSELNDPLDQRERFESQIREKDLGNDEANEMDTEFLDALEYGMPPCGGIGIGIDRFVMMLTNTDNIRDVILFPHMKGRK